MGVGGAYDYGHECENECEKEGKPAEIRNRTCRLALLVLWIG